jgi:hypothetical protein
MNQKEKNNQLIDDLKKDLIKMGGLIPISEKELFLDFTKYILEKLFTIKKNNNTLDISYVINYITIRIKNTKNKIHQNFWANVLKRILKTINELKKIY